MQRYAEGFDSRIRLRHITCFLEVARLKSVGRAAAMLALSQPAVSKTIQELEQILEVELFDRSRRQIALTSFGEVFQRYAGASLTALRQGVQSMALGADAGAVMLTVGALPTVSARILPAALARLARLSPGVRPRVVTGPNAYLLSQLRLGDVDLVIGRMAEPDVMTGLSFEHLYSERIALVVRPGHPLCDPAEFDLAAIARHQVLMPPPGSIIRPTVERFLIAHGIGPLAEQIETVSDSFARSYLRLTDAIWFISEGVVADDVASGFLTMLPADMSDTLGPVGLTMRTDSELAVPAQVFTQCVRETVAELGAVSPPR